MSHQPATGPSADTGHQTAAVSPVEAAWADHDQAHQAWAANPGSPDLLDAYITARQRLNSARQAPTTALDLDRSTSTVTGGGPIVITPVIEWWATTIET